MLNPLPIRVTLRQIAKREIQLIWRELRKRGLGASYVLELIRRNYFYRNSTVYSIIAEDLQHIDVEHPSEFYKLVFGMKMGVELAPNENGFAFKFTLPTYTSMDFKPKVNKRKSRFTGTKTLAF